MTRSPFAVAAAPAVLLLASVPASAREAYLVAAAYSGGWAEIRGATGWIRHPGVSFAAPSTYDFTGIAAEGTTGYLLTSGSAGSTLWSVDLTTGSKTPVPLALPASSPPLSDIAVLNGTLYAAHSTGTAFMASSFNVERVNADGSLTTVLTVATPNHAPGISASPTANRVVAVAVTDVGGADSRAHFLIDPTTWGVVQSVPTTGQVHDIALTADGQTLISDSTSLLGALGQVRRAVPGFAIQGTDAYPDTIGHAGGPRPASLISDGFDLPYPSSSPAVVELGLLNTTGTADLTTPKLFRRGPVSFAGDLAITNYATPDGTTLDQVAANAPVWQQTAGPTPVQVSTTVAPAGDLSVRAVAHTSFSVNADTAARGVYAVKAVTSLTARYTTTADQSTRGVTVLAAPTVSFAVDPVSDNFVGNGDFSLSNYGWTGAGVTYWPGSGITPETVMELGPDYSQSTAHASQALELGTPNQPMALTFDCATDTHGGYAADLTVRLAGHVLISGLSVGNINFRTVSISITDPALMGLQDPVLDFDVYRPGGFGAGIYLDNVRLTAVPEPVTTLFLALLPLAAAAPRPGRRRR